MTTTVYLRPIGRVTRPPGRNSAAPDKLLRIGGHDDVAFSTFELIERHSDGWTGRRLISLEEARQMATPSNPAGERIATLLARFVEPRGALAHVRLDRPLIMGIVNVTPDSFSDGGQHPSTGITRCNSSSSGTGAAPGREDSPPISRISAPSASRRCACAMAASVLGCCPP